MKIVIELDNNLVEGIKTNDLDVARMAVRNYQATIADAIKNGVPLSKGHGRLIDADALYDNYEYADYDFYKTVHYAPTIIEADKGDI